MLAIFKQTSGGGPLTQALGPMKRFLRTLLAFIVAAMTPAAMALLIVVTLDDTHRFSEALSISRVVFVVAAAHVLVFGIPTYLFLASKKLLRWWSMSLAGFIFGCLPAGILGWPLWFHGTINYSSSAYWHGAMRDLVINGVPTLYGWLSYVQDATSLGILGAFSALGFWLCLAREPRA